MEQQNGMGLLFLSEDAFAESLRGLGVAHWGVSRSRVIVFGLGKGVSSASRLEPRSTLRSSALQVEFIKVLEFECFLDILRIVLFLLGGVGSTDLLVLGLGQTSRDVRVVGKLALLQLIQ